MRSPLACVAVALALTACAVTERPRPGLAPPEVWRLEGRLALSNGRDGGSGALSWRHEPGLDRMRFVGALGRGSWELFADDAGAVLTTSDGRRLEAPSVAALVARHLEWDLPVAALGWWVVGEPAPGLPLATRRDGAGRLEVLEQAGWSIRFEGYLDVAGRWLPRKLTARRGEDQVRLLVRKWTPGSTDPAGLSGARAN